MDKSGENPGASPELEARAALGPAALARARLDRIRRDVELELAQFFRKQEDLTSARAPEVKVLVDAVRDLTLRGGKRLRPQLLVLGHAVAQGADQRVIRPACALELLQSHFLIQDDWMDQDEMRRGGPAVHKSLAERFGDRHLGASAAILASDLALVFAFELVGEADLAPERISSGVRVLSQMAQEVVSGQVLDLLGAGSVAQIHSLKTAAYTARGPLLLGAALGGASPVVTASLETIGESLGRAFQLRDDILGTFGEPDQTGKPAGRDLLVGKRTALLDLADRRLSSAKRQELRELAARAGDPNVLDRARALLETAGIREEVEAEISALTAKARRETANLALSPELSAAFDQVVDRMTVRAS